MSEYKYAILNEHYINESDNSSKNSWWKGRWKKKTNAIRFLLRFQLFITKTVVVWNPNNGFLFYHSSVVFFSSFFWNNMKTNEWQKTRWNKHKMNEWMCSCLFVCVCWFEIAPHSPEWAPTTIFKIRQPKNSTSNALLMDITIFYVCLCVCRKRAKSVSRLSMAPLTYIIKMHLYIHLIYTEQGKAMQCMENSS